MKQTTNPNPTEGSAPEATHTAAAAAKKEQPMKSTRTVKRTAAKAGTAQKPASKPPKATSAKKVPGDKASLRTLAIRVSTADLERVHRAAGPRNMSQFVTSIVLAGAAGDEAAFRSALKAAREARAAK